jgi:hypothetical protein
METIKKKIIQTIIIIISNKITINKKIKTSNHNIIMNLKNRIKIIKMIILKGIFYDFILKVYSQRRKIINNEIKIVKIIEEGLKIEEIEEIID